MRICTEDKCRLQVQVCFANVLGVNGSTKRIRKYDIWQIYYTCVLLSDSVTVLFVNAAPVCSANCCCMLHK